MWTAKSMRSAAASTPSCGRPRTRSAASTGCRWWSSRAARRPGRFIRPSTGASPRGTPRCGPRSATPCGRPAPRRTLPPRCGSRDLSGSTTRSGNIPHCGRWTAAGRCASTGWALPVTGRPSARRWTRTMTDTARVSTPTAMIRGTRWNCRWRTAACGGLAAADACPRCGSR